MPHLELYKTCLVQVSLADTWCVYLEWEMAANIMVFNSSSMGCDAIEGVCYILALIWCSREPFPVKKEKKFWTGTVEYKN